MHASFDQSKIRAIIGLGNPGKKYERTRHNIGFRVLDAICDHFYSSWRESSNMLSSSIRLQEAGQEVYIIKPQTFMNSSGSVIPFLQKKGIKSEEIIVVHDELEKKFGDVNLKFGGSAKGHNGLRSIIEKIGQDFWRIRCGIGRPLDKDDVGNFVLSAFTSDEEMIIPNMINQSIKLLIKL